MRIAHLSDLHLLSLQGAVPLRLFNKRLTGYANLRLHRSSIHKPEAVHAIAREIRRLDIEHVVITGDVSNLALEREFALVRAFLRDELAFPPDRVSIVPGNHDVYTAGAHRARRFFHYLGDYVSSDMPELAASGVAHVFPFVRLRGPVAFIGLSTAVPRPPLVASGRLGAEQIDALRRALAHPEVAARTPVILQHHPLHNPPSRAKTLLEGLTDAKAEGEAMARVPRGLLLHGHLHRRVHRTLRTDRGHIDVVGATSASLMHDSDDRMAGFNLYEIAADGAIQSIVAHRWSADTRTFRDVPIPRA